MSTLANKISNLDIRLARLQAQRALWLEKEATLFKFIGEAKGRIALREEVTGALDEMLERNHRRTVGLYETLLTAIRQDVLPKEDSTISLDLFCERGLPALDIKVINNGNEESLISGSGNSLKNVICAGLRYIALARSQNRRFLVLDEADCWLRANRIENFAAVVHKMSSELKIQTLMISHHGVEAFRQYSHVINLYYNRDGVVSVERESEDRCKWTDEQKGIRFIRLSGVQNHENTYIPLSPGLNVMTGDNEIGKSAVVFALRAVGYGEANDGLIRHGYGAAVLELGLEDGMLLRWTRVRKGSPKVLYELFDADGKLLHKTPAGRDVPDWVTDVLGIFKPDGLDVQIGSNLSPVFLIDKPSTQQASILSVGREVGTLFTVIDKYKKWVAEDTKLVKEGEQELTLISNKLFGLAGIDPMLERLAAVRAGLIACQESEVSSLGVDAIATKLDASSARCQKLVGIALPGVSTINELVRSAQINAIANRLAQNKAQCEVVSPKLVLAPSVAAMQPIIDLAIRLQASAAKAAIRLPNEKPAVLQLADVSKIITVGKRLSMVTKTRGLNIPVAVNQPAINPISSAILTKLMVTCTQVEKNAIESKSVDVELALLEDEHRGFELAQGVCPLCESKLAMNSRAA